MFFMNIASYIVEIDRGEGDLKSTFTLEKIEKKLRTLEGFRAWKTGVPETSPKQSHNVESSEWSMLICFS